MRALMVFLVAMACGCGSATIKGRMRHDQLTRTEAREGMVLLFAADDGTGPTYSPIPGSTFLQSCRRIDGKMMRSPTTPCNWGFQTALSGWLLARPDAKEVVLDHLWWSINVPSYGLTFTVDLGELRTEGVAAVVIDPLDGRFPFGLRAGQGRAELEAELGPITRTEGSSLIWTRVRGSGAYGFPKSWDDAGSRHLRRSAAPVSYFSLVAEMGSAGRLEAIQLRGSDGLWEHRLARLEQARKEGAPRLTRAQWSEARELKNAEWLASVGRFNEDTQRIAMAEEQARERERAREHARIDSAKGLAPARAPAPRQEHPGPQWHPVSLAATDGFEWLIRDPATGEVTIDLRGEPSSMARLWVGLGHDMAMPPVAPAIGPITVREIRGDRVVSVMLATASEASCTFSALVILSSYIDQHRGRNAKPTRVDAACGSGEGVNFRSSRGITMSFDPASGWIYTPDAKARVLR